MFKLEISLKRVQTFIFDVPRLKAMLGANALIGQVMRHELPELLGNRGKALTWPADIRYSITVDPLDGTVDPDQPAELYKKGILARDGGHFMAVFAEKPVAEEFRRRTEEKLAEMLPGVLFDAEIKPFPEPDKAVDVSSAEETKDRSRKTRGTHLFDLPVLQVCQETGREPASEQGEKGNWQARSVTLRFEWGGKFYRGGETKDIISLMRSALYPRKMGWREPDDLAQLAAGGYVALIHADGNGIGKRYNDWKSQAKTDDPIAKEAHGEAFFHGMRVAVRRALVDALEKTFIEPGGKRPYEVLMLGGDDLLLICRADQALELAKFYAAELKDYKLADGSPLDVAIGVAIAQKTYPLHRLNELAESLASSAKRLYRSLRDTEKASVIDWQVVTQSWFEGVAEARRNSDSIRYTVNGKTETLLLTGRPYRVTGDAGLEGLLRASEGLDGGEDKAARSPLRSLRTACERGRLSGEMAFGRLAQPLKAKLGWVSEKDHGIWKPIGGDDKPVYLTRALDIIGIREIGRLGSKKND